VDEHGGRLLQLARLILRDIQDLDVAEVAQALSLSANQVKVYTFRARIMAQTTHKHRRRVPPHWLGLDLEALMGQFQN